MEKRTLTTGEVATYCGVNFRTVIRWIKRGLLKAYQLPGRGDNRIAVDDFLDFLRENKMPVPPELRDSQREGRVLIVDDDPKVARNVQRVLRRGGFETEIAHDGFRAGILFETFLPAVMTLDLKMAGLGGLEVIRFVRSTTSLKDIKILVVSAMPRAELQQALSAGADDVLEKPFKNQELVDKVTALARSATVSG